MEQTDTLGWKPGLLSPVHAHLGVVITCRVAYRRQAMDEEHAGHRVTP